MKLVNETQGCELSPEIEVKDSFFGRFRGLMVSFRKDIILECRRQSVVDASIHMMFMLYSLDVVWADADWVVVDVRKKVPAFSLLKPSTWRIYRPQEPAKYVVELGASGAGTTEKGDRLVLK